MRRKQLLRMFLYFFVPIRISGAPQRSHAAEVIKSCSNEKNGTAAILQQYRLVLRQLCSETEDFFRLSADNGFSCGFLHRHDLN